MNAGYVWIRYVLIILPAIASMYLESYQTNGRFVFCVLALLALVEVQRNRILPRLNFVLAAIEIIYCTWLWSAFQGILYFTFFSALFSLPCLRSFGQRIAIFTLGLAALSYTLLQHSTGLFISVILFYLVLGTLLHQLQTIQDAKSNMEHLNDELRRKHYELGEARKQLVDYAKKAADAAQMEERHRISQEIHDELGHKLIRLKLMLDAAVQILPNKPDKGMEMVSSVHKQLIGSMELLRATVRRMNPGTHKVRAYSLEKLIDEIREQAHLQIEFQIDGMPYPLYPSVEVVLYRNAQEAITNAMRHGEASRIWIQLVYEPERVRMSVSNNGLQPKDESKWGLGLSGMQERTQIIGGQLIIHAGEPFTVITTVPSRQKG